MEEPKMLSVSARRAIIFLAATGYCAFFCIKTRLLAWTGLYCCRSNTLFGIAGILGTVCFIVGLFCLLRAVIRRTWLLVLLRLLLIFPVLFGSCISVLLFSLSMPTHYTTLTSPDREHRIVMEEYSAFFDLNYIHVYEKTSFCTMRKLQVVPVDNYHSFQAIAQSIRWQEDGFRFAHPFYCGESPSFRYGERESYP